MKSLKQHCYIWNVWLTWLALPLLVLAIGIFETWWGAAFVLVVAVVSQILYIRYFPRMSRAMGYGSVEDVDAENVPRVGKVDAKVILYTASVCPFCPIVKERLQRLQRELGFEMEEVDVTFQLHLVREKGLRSVPVIEYDGRYRSGNATTAELAAFLTESLNPA